MAGNLESVLAKIPFYGGYMAKRQADEAQTLSELQQTQGVQGLLASMQQQKDSAALRETLAASGGDVEKALAGALQSGNIKAAHDLAPLAKLAQERRMSSDTVTGLQALNERFSPQAAAPDQPQELGAGQPVAQAGDQPPAAATPQDARQRRIDYLTQLGTMPKYANNPIVQQRIQAEIDKLGAQKPMVEHNFSVGGDQVQPHISYDEGRTWQPIPGSKPSAKFAKQVAPVMGAADKPKGDFSKTGEDFLASLPAEDQSIVKKLANYEINPIALSSKGGHREKMLSLAAQYNPEYDDTQYANKRRAITQFGSGPQGNTVRSLNVAIEHIDTLKRAGEALKNGDFTPGNKAYNEIVKVFGVTPPNTFEGIRDMVANEVVKGTIGNAGALQDRAEAAAKVKASSSPQQLNELMNGWTELMGGQVKGLEQQYQGATGLKDFRQRYLRQRTLDAIAAAESKATPAAPSAQKSVVDSLLEKYK